MAIVDGIVYPYEEVLRMARDAAAKPPSESAIEQ
jgi:hypothetical protein